MFDEVSKQMQGFSLNSLNGNRSAIGAYLKTLIKGAYFKIVLKTGLVGAYIIPVGQGISTSGSEDVLRVGDK